MPPETTDVSTSSDLDNNPLLKVESFDELLSNQTANVIRGASLIGDGFALTKKEDLVGIPMIVIDWEFLIDEKSGREYATVRAILKTDGVNNKVRFNDGSTGVLAQCKEMEEAGVVPGTPVFFGGGLRASNYVKEGVGDATTYYFAA